MFRSLARYLAFIVLPIFIVSCGPEAGDSGGPSSDTGLLAITVTGAELNEALAADVTSYTADVSFAVESVTLNLDLSDTDASITINGTAVESGVDSSAISLAEGDNTITVVVTAEDGTTKTYTITVTRTAPNTDATLLDLSIDGITLVPAFQPSQESYTVEVGFLTSVVNIDALANSDVASINLTHNEEAVISGSDAYPISLVEGNNNIALVITSESGGAKTYTIMVTRDALSDLAQQPYLKASNEEAIDRFGDSVDVSGDTLVVGAWSEDGSDNSQKDQGAAYVFIRNGSNWSEQQKLYASDAAASDNFGSSVAIDGNTLVVGAPRKNSYDGVVYVFIRDGSIWTEQESIQLSDIGAQGKFGNSVDVDGDTLVVGAKDEADSMGAVYVFTRDGNGDWSLQDKLTANNGEGGIENPADGMLEGGDYFGNSVALSGDTLLVGAHGEDGIGNTHSNSGAAYIFTREDNVWIERDYLKASNAGVGDEFGSSVALDGDTAAVGSPRESGIDNTSNYSGAVYVFTGEGNIWNQEAYLKANSINAGDFFGVSVGLDGDTLVMGAWDPSDSGDAYVFTRNGINWSQRRLLKASTPSVDSFGYSVALDSGALVVGAWAESSRFDFGESDEGATYSGAAYIFE